MTRPLAVLLLAAPFVALAWSESRPADDPLPSWNDTPTKKALLAFVAKVTKEGGPDFVPVAERIATFDNDGTLWCEQPMYTQLEFAFSRVKALADKNPAWKEKQPFKGVLENDLKAVVATGQKGLVELILATHAGMTSAAFEKDVTDFLATAKHPRFGRPYTACVYQPMVELVAYLKANGFKTYIVSGGGIEFMRPWTDAAYGIPPERVIGTVIKTRYEVRDGVPVFVRLPEFQLVDDHAGKPVGIHEFIGRRPVMAFGNSDGDYEMLQYTTTGQGPRFGLIVHHTDAAREYAYDRESFVGHLEKALDDAPKYGWVVASMKDDWKAIFPPTR